MTVGYKLKHDLHTCNFWSFPLLSDFQFIQGHKTPYVNHCFDISPLQTCTPPSLLPEAPGSAVLEDPLGTHSSHLCSHCCHTELLLTSSCTPSYNICLKTARAPSVPPHACPRVLQHTLGTTPFHSSHNKYLLLMPEQNGTFPFIEWMNELAMVVLFQCSINWSEWLSCAPQLNSLQGNPQCLLFWKAPRDWSAVSGLKANKWKEMPQTRRHSNALAAALPSSPRSAD